jgi:hypothetical protein
MRALWRDNSLALVFLAFFVVALVGQAIAGWHEYNNDALVHHEESIAFGRYVVSSSFGNAVMENWQSEYLQFTLYILLTVWFIQRGSPESKEPGKSATESDRDQRVGRHARDDSPRWARLRGVRLWIYSNSLLLVMGLIWLGSWFAQSVTGWSDYSADQLTHGEPRVDYVGYLGSAQFWESTLQNWQSEFLAVGSMAILAVYLRQRGSPESKPVGAPHSATGIEG